MRTDIVTPVAPRVVGFYVFPGHGMLDLAGPLSAFKVLDHIDRPGRYETVVLSRTGGPVSSEEGVDVVSVTATSAPIDTLVVIGGPGVFCLEERDFAAVREYAKTARRTASVCTGAFLLAGAGLLDGRKATTHWLHAPRLAKEFPSVQVEADRIYVRDGPIWSSAGIAAGIDLALALIEDDCGAEIARAAAHYLVVPFRRRGGQSQYSEMLAFDPPSDRIAGTLVFAQAHLSETLTVERLATIACLSPRQFSRSFHHETGETPASAIERLRAEAAKARVETGIEPIESIASSLGFLDPERMRRAFVRRFGKSPQALRRASRVGAPAAPDTTPRKAALHPSGK
ncbi:MAG: Transcriptional regulator, AraC family with amidase-like domain [Phenylobacterium sp.]|jgi:transcriptional regulator GlxA family with amidase domain|nr:Transcriptional regulator, AraC family with amidase-like domain [Phenylobacterium sp.]